jgi:hypothetical protein
MLFVKGWEAGRMLEGSVGLGCMGEVEGEYHDDAQVENVQ